MVPVGWDSFSPLSVIIVIFICLLSAGIWVLWLRHSDTYAGNKRRDASPLGFFIAGIFSAPLSILFTYANPFYWTTIEGPWHHLLVVGPSEEVAKLVTLLAVSSWKRAIKEPLDALILGAAVGIGFAVFENFVYGLEYGIPVLIIRSAISAFAHMSWSAFAAYGFYALKYNGTEERPISTRLLGLLAVSLVHGLLNISMYFDGLTAIALIMDLVFFLALLAALSYERERSAYRRYTAGDWRAGNDAVTRALREDPYDLELLIRRGYYRLCGGRYPEAKRDFSKALSLSPRATECRAWVAAAEIASGQSSAAGEALKQAVKKMAPERRQFLRKALVAARKPKELKSAIEIIAETPNPIQGIEKPSNKLLIGGYRIK